MLLRNFLVPVLALVIAIATAVLAKGWLTRQVVPPALVAAAAGPAKPTRQVLVAAADLQAGEFVRPEGVRWQAWPEGEVPASYYVEGSRTIEEVTGAVLRRATAEGEPIVEGNVVKPGERGFLAAVLDADMRAVSVPVDEASSNAGLIFPGDRVDLILTQSLPERDGEPGRRVSETVLEDARVLAMGRRLSNDGKAPPEGPARTTTLEVTPLAAEKVALVTELGKLSLSLRSLAQSGQAGPRTAPAVTWDSDVSPALRPGDQPPRTLTIIRGTAGPARSTGETP